MKHVAQARPPPSHLRFYLKIRGPSPEHPHHFLNIGGPSPRQLHHLLNTRGASPERPYQFLKIRGPSPRHLHHSVNITGPSPEYPYHFLNIGGPLPEGSYHFLTIEDLLNMISIRVFGHSVFQISKKMKDWADSGLAIFIVLGRTLQKWSSRMGPGPVGLCRCVRLSGQVGTSAMGSEPALGNKQVDKSRGGLDRWIAGDGTFPGHLG